MLDGNSRRAQIGVSVAHRRADESTARSENFMPTSSPEDPVLAQIVQKIVNQIPAVRRIILFGSRASGLARSDSDYDLLVVAELPDSHVARALRVRRALRPLGVGLDVVVVTPAEYAKLKDYRSGVVAWAERDGRVLHEAA